MDEDQLFLRPAAPTSPTDLYTIQDDLDFIKHQLVQLTTANAPRGLARRDAGVLGGAVAAVTLIEAFARACN
jgi:hypothetical protein